VLALKGTCLLLEAISVGGYMCLHWKLEVFALHATCVYIRSCKCSRLQVLGLRRSILVLFCFHYSYRGSHWKRNMFMLALSSLSNNY
jgi:hypothetical protein